MDLPLAAGLALGNPRLAFVEQFERMIHGVADFALGRGRDAVAGIERGIDGGFQGGKGHRNFLEISLGEEWSWRANGRGFFGIWGGRVKNARPGTT